VTSESESVTGVVGPGRSVAIVVQEPPSAPDA
jgi:hypothetical protein